MFDEDLFEKSVVLVSADTENRTWLRQQLVEHGMTVFEAGTQAEALDLLGDEWTDIDLVVIDLEMPDMVGIGLARIVRAWLPELPVLILTPAGREGSSQLGVAGKAAELISARARDDEPN